jgi:serine/threonine protein kinase
METLYYSQRNTRPGELAGSYQILRKIGEGAMGEVHEAVHLRLPGRYAVKMMVPELAPQPGAAFARFRREAEVLSRVRHPNVVHILDFDVTADGRPFLAMEYLDGILLRDEIATRGPLPLTRVLDVVDQTASALAAMHDLGIVHRDLKPENLFLIPMAGDRELVKVTDFGISKIEPMGDELRLTQVHAVFGTPSYMSPEQALGHTASVDGRTDQFALAAITYEMLTGRLAFPGESLGETLFQVLEGNPPPPAELCQQVPAGVSAAIMRALSKDPEQRFPDVRAFAAALIEGAKPAAVDATPAVEESTPVYDWACQEVPTPAPTIWQQLKDLAHILLARAVERATS